MAGSVLLKPRGLTYYFSKRQKALDDINLEVKKTASTDFELSRKGCIGRYGLQLAGVTKLVLK